MRERSVRTMRESLIENPRIMFLEVSVWTNKPSPGAKPNNAGHFPIFENSPSRIIIGRTSIYLRPMLNRTSRKAWRLWVLLRQPEGQRVDSYINLTRGLIVFRKIRVFIRGPKQCALPNGLSLYSLFCTPSFRCSCSFGCRNLPHASSITRYQFIFFLASKPKRT